MEKIINKFNIKLINNLELPPDRILGIGKITIIADNTIEIENSYGVIEYMKERIKIDMKTSIITIFGSDLAINNIDDDTISIKGRIEKIFLKEEL